MNSYPTKKSICIVPQVAVLGGPGSFRASLVSGLTSQGFQIVDSPNDNQTHSVLVMGGTRNIGRLIQARLQGKRIVQRLNGMNWIHRVAVRNRNFQKISLRYFIRSEINNLLLAIIRKYIATHIIYQSHFSQDWWNRVYGTVSASSKVVYNATDLDLFTPSGPGRLPQDHYRVLMVEGNVFGGYQMGLENAINLVEVMQNQCDIPVKLQVIGNVPDTIQKEMQNHPINITWSGVLKRNQIPEVERSSHVLFSADLNAACPNSVIEALACGLPVTAFDTGGLKELVQNGAGKIVPYGADYWTLQPPVIAPLAEAALEICANQEAFRQAARTRAVSTFRIDTMVSNYLKSLCE